MLRKIIASAAVVALFLCAIWPAFQSAAMPMDEGMVLVYPERILKGELPYRDFESITGPGNPLILAGAYAPLGTNIFVERSVGLIYRLLLLVAVFGIAQRWGVLVAAACSFTSALFIVVTDVMATTWFSAVSFAVCCFWAIADRTSKWRCLAAGLLAGISLLGRCDFGPALIISLIPGFLMMERRHKLWFLGGGFLGVAPLIWMTFAIGPAQIFHSLFVFPVLQLNPGRHLPMAEADNDTIKLVGLHLVAGVTNISAGIVELRRPTTRDRGLVLLGVGLLGLGLIHYVLQRFDAGHALNAGLVAFSFLPLSISILISRVKKSVSVWATATAILVSLTAIHVWLPSFTRYFYRGLRVTSGISPARQPTKDGEELEAGDRGFFIRHNGRAFLFGFSYAAEDADKVLNELERVSLPGQRLFVGPGDLRLTNYCDTYVYHLEPQLTPATYFLEMNPGSANAPGSRLSGDLKSADWVLLNRRWDYLNESNRSTHLGPAEPNQIIREDFDFWWQRGSYLLFRNKRLSNSITAPPPS